MHLLNISGVCLTPSVEYFLPVAISICVRKLKIGTTSVIDRKLGYIGSTNQLLVRLLDLDKIGGFSYYLESVFPYRIIGNINAIA